MNVSAESLKISVDDYLEGELLSDIKHEYINGKIFAISAGIHAMAGAKRAHNIISGNLFAALHHHLRKKPCQVFVADMKVAILTETEDIFYYPDVHVSCDKENHSNYNSQAKLIIEVLSNSTERKDRVEKFHNYRKLDSLEEYVLVAQDCQRVEIYRRNQAWDLSLFTGNDSLVFKSVDLEVMLADIYQDVEFES